MFEVIMMPYVGWNKRKRKGVNLSNKLTPNYLTKKESKSP